jgi:fatty-acyl-CoA synthase
LSRDAESIHGIHGNKRAGEACGSPAQAWARALQLTTPIARFPEHIFPHVIDAHAAQHRETLALLSERESLTYGMLVERSNRYARWALVQDIAKGEAVGLLMPNRPEYLAIWLGITKIGGLAALLNTHLSGRPLAHSINAVAPKVLIVAAELSQALDTALPDLDPLPEVWVHGSTQASYHRIDTEISKFDGNPLSMAEVRPVTIDDPALYIYTSGTTGLPKAAKVTHGRLMQSSHWFCGMMGIQATDRIYNCLPMYHSVGGVQVPGAVLAGGGSVVIREKFSARNFWSDIVQSECTLIQYIGELCRYLLHTPSGPHDTTHQVRMACGNGLAPDVWRRFQARFQIPHIFEFYGATESNVTLCNIEGEPGAIGRIPSYLAHRFPAALVKFDFDNSMPLRNGQGFCVACAPNEVGEAIGEILQDRSNVGTRFDGYTSKEASEAKVLRNVFQPGDAWFRTGDLMRKDERGFLYFVDRVGDTFRWKGENVATSDVSEAICEFPGIQEANVYGVGIPGADGKAGMAAIKVNGELNLIEFRAHLNRRLPDYARPVLLRILTEMTVTGTFKYNKTSLAREGYNPAAIADQIFFNDTELGAFVRLNEVLYSRIQSGEVWQRALLQ